MNNKTDYEAEERAAIYEYDANMSREEAEQKAFNEQEPETERV